MLPDVAKCCWQRRKQHFESFPRSGNSKTRCDNITWLVDKIFLLFSVVSLFSLIDVDSSKEETLFSVHSIVFKTFKTFLLLTTRFLLAQRNSCCSQFYRHTQAKVRFTRTTSKIQHHLEASRIDGGSRSHLFGCLQRTSNSSSVRHDNNPYFPLLYR